MQVKNISARGWMIDGTMVKPGDTETIPDSWYAAVKDNPDLKISDYEAVDSSDNKDSEKELTKAEIVAALKEAGIEFNPADKKADLQVLLDGINKE